MSVLKLATYNINGIRTRLPVLLEWLAKETPDIACLQELQGRRRRLPGRRAARGRLRRAVARPALVERRGDPRARQPPAREPARSAW